MNNKFLFALLFALASCHTSFQSNFKEGKNNKIISDANGESDQDITKIIAPYKTKLDSLMNIRIMVADADLTKGNPEGSLGNMVCDLLMRYAQKQKMQADFCVMNNGGLRIPTLYKGDVFIRTVYELMPFDNQLVLVKISGAKCLELFALIAETNGAPVAGLQMVIDGNKATEIKVGGKPFDVNADYWVLTSDYLANGGDNAEAFKNPLERMEKNSLIRDILIAQMRDMYFDGETLQAKIDGRITKK
jgi:2',3'-cyclic-nucleotide 2'-phosphodiesterase (5'-nucleotidase family)